MDLSSLKPSSAMRRGRKRVGRGPSSGLGKTSGRGHKGQKSRSGYARSAGFEGGQMPLYRRLPKRGFTHGTRQPFAIVNVDTLDRLFEDGAVVTPDAVFGSGLIDKQVGGVKVLGRGEITKKLTVKVNFISESARKKIEAAGGAVELLGPAKVRPAAVAEAPKQETVEE